MTNVLFSTKEMEDWSIDDITAFARNSGLDDEDVAILKKQKIVGKAFMKESYKFLRDCGLPRGSISALLQERDKFLHRMFTAIIDHVLLFCSCHLVSFLF